MQTKTKIILVLEVVFVIAVIGYVMFGNAPKQAVPIAGQVVSGEFDFEYENGKIMISTNPEFEGYFVLEKGKKTELPPGTYYWKVKKWFRETEIRNFTVEGKVSLTLKEKNETYRVTNTGNVDLNISVTTDNENLANDTLLGKYETLDIEKKNNTKIGGKQK